MHLAEIELRCKQILHIYAKLIVWNGCDFLSLSLSLFVFAFDLGWQQFQKASSHTTSIFRNRFCLLLNEQMERMRSVVSDTFKFSYQF